MKRTLTLYASSAGPRFGNALTFSLNRFPEYDRVSADGKEFACEHFEYNLNIPASAKIVDHHVFGRAIQIDGQALSPNDVFTFAESRMHGFSFSAN